MIVKLHKLVQELESTSSTKEKVEILEDHISRNPKLFPLLAAVYDPFVQYYLTPEAAAKKNEGGGLFSKVKEKLELGQALYLFSSRKASGNKAIEIWKNTLSTIPKQYHYLCNRILGKDLKCRVGVKTLNKVLKKLNMKQVPVYEVCLGHLWKDEEFWKDETRWYMSRKLDGIRCNVIIKKGTILILSRQGKAFETLKALEDVFKEYKGPDCIFDGEITLDKYEDDFTGLMKRIRKKDHQIKNMVFNVFDWVPIPGDDTLFIKRQKILKAIVEGLHTSLVQRVLQIRVKSEYHFRKMINMADEKGWEGLMLRKNTRAQIGRTKDLLKVKNMQDAEYEVMSIEMGTMVIVIEGKQKEVETMARANIVHKGSIVGVGSGWSVEQRQKYAKTPALLIGKVITVQYFEETENQDGGHGLRFPVVKHVHGDKREL